MTPTIDILADAKRLIEEHGWCQEIMHHIDGRHCMVGAILCAAGETPSDRWPFTRTVAAQAAEEVVQQYLPSWNDKEGRTVEEVLAALDRAMEIVAP